MTLLHDNPFTIHEIWDTDPSLWTEQIANSVAIEMLDIQTRIEDTERTYLEEIKRLMSRMHKNTEPLKARQNTLNKAMVDYLDDESHEFVSATVTVDNGKVKVAS